jgi:hypothetical protein
MTALTESHAIVTVNSRRDRWPLPRVLIFLLANAFLGLMVDIRVEHVNVVHEHAVAWLPIIYSGLMAIACLLACIYWNKTTRLLMLPLFSVAFIIGGIGFYFHNYGHIAPVIRTSIQAWTDPKMTHSDAPPVLAPLAFTGLGALGFLAIVKRFNAEPVNTSATHDGD